MGIGHLIVYKCKHFARKNCQVLTILPSQEDNEKCDNLSSHFRGLSLVNKNHMIFWGPVICQLTLFSLCHWLILFKTANPLFDTCLAAFGDILNFKMKVHLLLM